MKKTQVNTRVDEDTAEILEEHCDEQGTTKAEVLRRATRKYLAEQGHDVPATDGGATATDKIQRTIHLSNVVLVLALLWVGAVFELSPPSVVTIGTGTALLVLLGGLLKWELTGVR